MPAQLQGEDMNRFFMTLLATVTLLQAECSVEMLSTPEVEWTAYKTPRKIGVDGGFLATVYHGKREAMSLSALLLKGQVQLEVNNVDTKDPFRDAKLVQFFFNMMQGAVIDADVRSIKGDEKSGSLVVNVSMNNKAIDIPLKYEVKDGTFRAKGVLNLLDFNAQEPLKMLTLNCYAPHEGKTWEDVAVGFSFKLRRHCGEKK